MKVAFFLDNTHIPGIDFREPDQGNPGVGACEYLHVAIPFFLERYCGKEIDPIILAPHIDKLPTVLQVFQTESIIDAAKKAKELEADFFVFRPRQKEESEILDVIDTLELPAIGRAALTPYPEHVRKMASSKYFKALVCVGREQYDSLVDTPLKSKLAYIDNGLHVQSCWNDVEDNQQKDPRLVVYMGALVPMKGFHVLAEAWPKILKEVPDAKLSVIGSVKMYGDNLKVGPLGVADDTYERQYIIPYLCNSKGQIDPSVTFHGQMGREKFEIIRRASVGVANPTGQTETCCVSAVEMSACKTSVVSGAYYALLDTVLHNKTGLLGRGVDALARNISMCLRDPALVTRLGQAGYDRACHQYDFSVIAPRWNELFVLLKKGKIPQVQGRIKNLFYHYKCLRLVNSLFQKTFGEFMFWPSLFEIQKWISVWSRAILAFIKTI